MRRKKKRYFDSLEIGRERKTHKLISTQFRLPSIGMKLEVYSGTADPDTKKGVGGCEMKWIKTKDARRDDDCVISCLQ